MSRSHAILLLHAAATLALVGLIWVVQVVHYPLFAEVGAKSFVAFHDAHMQRIAWVVGPLMLTELATGLLLLAHGPKEVPFVANIVGLVLMLIVWASTLLLFMPLHAALGRGFDTETVSFLIWGNWLRTLIWTVRGGGVVWALSRILR